MLQLRHSGFFVTFFLVFVSGYLFGESGDAYIRKYTTEIKYNFKHLSCKTSLEIQINNREGENLAEFNIPYTKKNRITQLKASITDINGGAIRELGKKEVKDMSLFRDNIFYSDAFCKVFELKYNVFPYIIELEYVQEFEEFYMITDWDPVYHSGFKTQNAILDLQIPQDYKVNIYANHIKAAKPKTTDGKTVYHWEASYDTIRSDEVFSSLHLMTGPCVIISPVDFTYGIKGNMINWTAFGNYMYDLMRDGNALPKEEADHVLKLISNSISNIDKARVLYHYLQDETRYISVNIDIGGLQPYPADYVARNKFGDCKALVNYMHSMLKLAGIKSVYCLVQSGSNPHGIIKEIPSQQFDHAILMIPIEKDTVWLECTSNVLPFGYLGSFTQGREVLAIEKDRSCFVRTPAQSLADVGASCSYRFRTEKAGNCRAEIDFLLQGKAFERLATMKSDLNREEITEYLKHSLPFKSFELQTWSVDRPGRDDVSIRLKATVTLPDQPRTFGESLVYDFPALSLANFEKPSERKLPVHFSFPVSIHDTLVYFIPQGYTATSSALRKIENKFGSWQIQSTMDDTSVTIVRNWTLYPGDISISDYPSFYAFISTVKDTERKSKLIFKLKNR
ncbi:MAG: DUF3857 domain-containing protein [Bacteroidetes bacterium]|nr:DUF3857 domain-containing protein [Bacteroidota bacterium]